MERFSTRKMLTRPVIGESDPLMVDGQAVSTIYGPCAAHLLLITP
jgi:hypothetical protein